MIIRDGLITYYRDQPHTLNFIKALDKSYGKPKGQVQASISNFKKIDPNVFIRKQHKFLFEISFNSTKKKHKKIFWVFSVSSEESLNKWIGVLEEAKKIGLANAEEESEAQKKLEEDIAKELRQRALRDEASKRAADLERRRLKQKDKLLDEEKRKFEIENEIKRLQLEAEESRKKEEEEKRHQKYQKLLEFSWDYNFQKLWSKSIEENQNFEKNFTFGFRLFKHMGVFISKAKTAVKNIINELMLPITKRQAIPIDESNETFSYIIQNMLIRLTTKFSANGLWKTIGHEFRANDIVCDALYLLGRTEEKEFNFRVPLMCLIDYKGFRGLVMALAPLDSERTLIHGSKPDGVFICSPNIYDSLSKTSEALNIKEHVFEWNQKIGPVYVHLSVFVECHKSLGYRDLEEYVQETMGKDVPDEESLENHVYLLKLADVLPIDHFSKENPPDFGKRLRPEYFCCYKKQLSPDCFINISSNSFKDDLELIEAGARLRTEKIIKLVNDLDGLIVVPVDSQSLTEVFHSYGVNMRYLGAVAGLSKLPHIKEIIHVEIISRTCKNLFFSNLSEFIIKTSKEEENKKEPEERAFIRTSTIFDPGFITNKRSSANYRNRSGTKELLSFKFATVLTNSKSDDPTFVNNDTYNEKIVSECLVDFFNLVFGIDEDSDNFWNTVVVPFAEENFDAKFNLTKNMINLHGLLFSLCYHCSVFISFDSEIPLGRTSQLFSISEIQLITAKVKHYNMKNVEYKTLSEKSEYYKSIEKYSLALQTCELKLRISKALDPENKNLGDSEVLSEMSEILLETGDFENSIRKAKEALIQIHPLNAKSIKIWCILFKALNYKKLQDEATQCFENALSALNFHWGESHPLHSNLYCMLGRIYIDQDNLSEAIILYKNALLCCLKVLGPNHVLTASVYMELSSYYILINNMDNALDVNEKAYFIYEASYGKDSIITAAAAVKLSEVLGNLGRYSQAKEMIESSCFVYEKEIETKKNEYEFKVLMEKYYVSAFLGLIISVKSNDFLTLLVYADKLWAILNYSDNNDYEIVLSVLKYSLEAKLKCLSSKKKSLLLNWVYVRHKTNDEEIALFSNNFNSQRFISMVQNSGGIVCYIEKLVSTVFIYGERTERLEKDEENKFFMALNELKAILNIITSLVE